MVYLFGTLCVYFWQQFLLGKGGGRLTLFLLEQSAAAAVWRCPVWCISKEQKSFNLHTILRCNGATWGAYS